MRIIASILVVFVLAILLAGPVAAQNPRQPITAANAAELVQVQRLGRGTLEHVRFLPDGKTVLLGGGVGVFYYDPSAFSTETEPPLLDPPGEVRAMDVSPDGTLLAISAFKQVALYDAATRTLVHDTGITSGIDELHFSPDGKTLVLISSSKGAIFYDVAGKSERGAIEGRFRTNSATAFSPDGKLLVVPANDNSFQMFDTETLQPAGVFKGHTGNAQAAAFSLDGQTLYTIARDNSLRLWNVADQTERIAVSKKTGGENLEAPYALALSPDGKTLATGHGGGVVRLWNAADAAILKEVEAGPLPILDVAFSPDGKTLVGVIQPNGAILWDSALEAELGRVVGHTDQVFSVAFSLDSATLALATRDWMLYMWDVAGGKELNFSPAFPDTTSSITGNRKVFAYSPDGSTLATQNSRGTVVTLHDPHTGATLQTLDTDRRYVSNLVFSPDSTLIALGFGSGEVALFEVASGKQLALVTDGNANIHDLSWSADQTLLAAASQEGAVRIYGIR